MLIEYYLASRLGQVWLRLHPALKARIGEGPDLCLKAARDRQIPPGQLWQAQEFALRVWWRTGMVAILLWAPFIGIAATGRIGTDLAIAALILLSTAATVSIAQMFVLRLRANGTARYLRTGETKPLDGYESGYSAGYDFWAATSVAVILSAILFDAGLLH